ncbi:MAG: hypothetical protein ACI9OJ_003720, partial [Myxococcota bacterium]
MSRISLTLVLLTACAPTPPDRMLPTGVTWTDVVAPIEEVFTDTSDDMVEPPVSSAAPAIVVWRFDESEGYITRADGDCADCDGELYNFPKFGEKWRNALKGSGWNSNEVGGYLTLDGENDYVELPLATTFLQGRENWSLQARVRPCTSIVSEGVTPDQTLVSTGAGLFSWGIGNEDLHQVGYLRWEGNIAEVVSGTGGSASVSKGEWVWLTVTIGTNGVRLYNDEELVGSTTGPIVPLESVPRSLTFGAARLADGEVFEDISLDRPVTHTWSQLSTTYGHFCGDIDEIRLFDRVVQASELADLTANPAATPPAIVTDACSGSEKNACETGESPPYPEFDGVVSCVVDDAIALWKAPEAYQNFNINICGHNWSLCTVEDIQARTPNRPLTELGRDADDIYLLAQSG